MEVRVDLDIKPGEVRCPKCLSADIVPSKQRGLIDLIMDGQGRIPRHCRKCGNRFYVRASSVARTEPGT